MNEDLLKRLPVTHRVARLGRAALKVIVVVALTIMPACSSNHRAKADHILTAGADDGVWPQSASLRAGETIDVRLPSQAGTSYAWRLAEGLNDAAVVWVSRMVESARTKDRPGVASPTWDIFTFDAVRPGETTIQFVYDRTWERDTEPAQHYELLVVVTP